MPTVSSSVKLQQATKKLFVHVWKAYFLRVFCHEQIRILNLMMVNASTVHFLPTDLDCLHGNSLAAVTLCL